MCAGRPLNSVNASIISSFLTPYVNATAEAATEFSKK